jgi:uncharacterized MAPEG superfamily protein
MMILITMVLIKGELADLVCWGSLVWIMARVYLYHTNKRSFELFRILNEWRS